MGPKVKPEPREPIVLTPERMAELFDPDTLDELQREARGETVPSVTMTPEELERWTLTGEGDPWPDSSE